MNRLKTKDFFENSVKVQDELFYIGNLGNKDNYRITIVGTRKPSEYGKICVKKIISGLSNYPITIISGLAIGIDSLVHEAALLNNIHTIAIPGSSLGDDEIYPKTNVKLANKIISNNGALISLWEKQNATPWTFPARNAVMSGISDLVIVIEAKEDSGTMITAREAIKRKIKIAAVPGNIDSIFSTGPNSLIKNGAHLVTNSDDVLNILGIIKNDFKKIETDNIVLREIISGENNRDNIMIKTKLSISELNIELTMLEISGEITIDNNGTIRAI